MNECPNEQQSWYPLPSGSSPTEYATKFEKVMLEFAIANRTRHSEYASWEDLMSDARELTIAYFKELQKGTK